MDSSTSAYLLISNGVFKLIDNIPNFLNSEVFKIILSAFSGGLFAGLFANYFESKRMLSEKRRDKYFEHRNTIVQIEHELIPVRVNMSRNIASIEDALTNINDTNIRLILRFYKLYISTGLSLKLLNLTLINQYSELYILIESINSDMRYIDGIVGSITADINKGIMDSNKIQMYIQMLNHLKNRCGEADKKTLELVSFSQIIINQDDKKIIKTYLKKGGLIEYKIDNKEIKIKSKKTEKEENLEYKNGEARPKFIALYLDIKKV